MSAEVSERYVWYCADCCDGAQFDYPDEAAEKAREHNLLNHEERTP